MDWSLLKDPDVLKLVAAALGVGGGVLAVTDRILSRKKQLPPPPPTSNTVNNFFFGGSTPAFQPALFKKT
jgi:hypothetical protein